MGKFISSDFQTTRARPTPPTLSYLGAGLLFAAEAHSVICSPFSETSFLPQLSDTDHSLDCSEGKHFANPAPAWGGQSHVPIDSQPFWRALMERAVPCKAKRHGSVQLIGIRRQGHLPANIIIDKLSKTFFLQSFSDHHSQTRRAISLLQNNLRSRTARRASQPFSLMS